MSLPAPISAWLGLCQSGSPRVKPLSPIVHPSAVLLECFRSTVSCHETPHSLLHARLAVSTILSWVDSSIPAPITTYHNHVPLHPLLRPIPGSRLLDRVGRQPRDVLHPPLQPSQRRQDRLVVGRLRCHRGRRQHRRPGAFRSPAKCGGHRDTGTEREGRGVPQLLPDLVPDAGVQGGG